MVDSGDDFIGPDSVAGTDSVLALYEAVGLSKAAESDAVPEPDVLPVTPQRRRWYRWSFLIGALALALIVAEVVLSPESGPRTPPSDYSTPPPSFIGAPARPDPNCGLTITDYGFTQYAYKIYFGFVVQNPCLDIAFYPRLRFNIIDVAGHQINITGQGTVGPVAIMPGQQVGFGNQAYVPWGSKIAKLIPTIQRVRWEPAPDRYSDPNPELTGLTFGHPRPQKFQFQPTVIPLTITFTMHRRIHDRCPTVAYIILRDASRHILFGTEFLVYGGQQSTEIPYLANVALNQTNVYLLHGNPPGNPRPGGCINNANQ